MMKTPVIIRPKMRPLSPQRIRQLFQNFNMIVPINGLTFWCKFAIHNTLMIKEKTISMDLTVKEVRKPEFRAFRFCGFLMFEWTFIPFVRSSYNSPSVCIQCQKQYLLIKTLHLIPYPPFASTGSLLPLNSNQIK